MSIGRGCLGGGKPRGAGSVLKSGVSDFGDGHDDRVYGGRVVGGVFVRGWNANRVFFWVIDSKPTASDR